MMRGSIRSLQLLRRKPSSASCGHSFSKLLSSIAIPSSFQQVQVNEHKASSSTSYTPPIILNQPDHAETTALVDGLLLYTRQLMDTPRHPPNRTTTHVRHVVAFSGGIDSSLVLALLEASKRPGQADSVHAVIGVSSAVPQDQLRLARQVAHHIGIPLSEVATTEGTDETYIANTGQACLACKTHLYSALEAVAQHAAREHQQHHPHHSLPPAQHPHLLYNGTNADDVQDSTRVGLIAAQKFRVQSPLIYTTKENVRKAAKHLGLPNWNVAASPCLRSRLALGVQATQDHLQRIEAAESFVRRQLLSKGIVASSSLETTNLRVRLLPGNRAMLEIDAECLPRVEARLPEWQDYFEQTLQFSSLRARAFRSGSVSQKQTTRATEPNQEERLDNTAAVEVAI